MTGGLRLSGLGKRYGEVTAVDDVDLELAGGRLTAVVGPSGCGKSTLLSVVAGLLAPDTGSVALDGAVLDAVPAERRPIGLVFQKPLLFPNLDVAGNVGFGLRMRATSRAETRRRVEAMLELVQLGGLGGRRVGELSGGQEQRVALARALVLEPRVLLLDEPFSQLDAQLRVEMRTLVRHLHDESGLTTVFVTHDQAEAVDVADDIVLMLAGRVAGHGEPERFFRDPPSLAAARFFGVQNELSGTVAVGRFRGAGIDVPTDCADGPAVLVVRPEALTLDGRQNDDAVDARVLGARFAGTHVVVELQLDAGATVTAHVPAGATVEPGARVPVTLPAEGITVFPAGGDVDA